MSMLQERIEELPSAILDFTAKDVKVVGFMFPERLLSYYNNGRDCWYSKGVYPIPEQPIDYSKLKDSALFVILENGEEKQRYQFNVIKKFTQKYKDSEGEQRTKVISIRKCEYTEQYSFFTTEESHVFPTIESLRSFFLDKYKSKTELEGII